MLYYIVKNSTTNVVTRHGFVSAGFSAPTGHELVYVKPYMDANDGKLPDDFIGSTVTGSGASLAFTAPNTELSQLQGEVQEIALTLAAEVDLLWLNNDARTAVARWLDDATQIAFQYVNDDSNTLANKKLVVAAFRALIGSVFTWYGAMVGNATARAQWNSGAVTGAALYADWITQSDLSVRTLDGAFNIFTGYARLDSFNMRKLVWD